MPHQNDGDYYTDHVLILYKNDATSPLKSGLEKVGITIPTLQKRALRQKG